MKPVEDPQIVPEDRPISLLCVPCKILERLIYTCVNPIFNPSLPLEQAGFCCGKLIIDQATLLTQNIEDSFVEKQKTDAVFVDMTAAYRLIQSAPWPYL